MNKRKSIYLMILVLVSVGVYSNSLFNKFAFDDVHIVENNPLVKNPKNFLKAKNYFSEALKIDSQNTEAMYNLIVVNVSLGNKKEAKSLLEKYKNLNPDDPKINRIEAGIL